MWWNVRLKDASRTFLAFALEPSQQIAAFAKVLDQLPRLSVRIGDALAIAGIVFIVWQLHARGAAKPLTALAFHRRQLEQQRDSLRSVCDG